MTSTASKFSLAYLEGVRDVQYQTGCDAACSNSAILCPAGHANISPGHLAQPVVWSYARRVVCTMWRRYVIFISHLSVSMIDVVWATRAFALFDRSRKVGIFLGSLILSNAGLAGTHMAQCRSMNYLGGVHALQPAKRVGQGPRVSAFVAASSPSIRSASDQTGARPPLLSFLVKDAASNDVGVFLMCGISLAVFGANDQRSMAVFYWSLSLLSAIENGRDLMRDVGLSPRFKLGARRERVYSE
ncbi:hypothetical protein V8E55_006336 [Tylopilus felleus]